MVGLKRVYLLLYGFTDTNDLHSLVAVDCQEFLSGGHFFPGIRQFEFILRVKIASMSDCQRLKQVRVGVMSLMIKWS